MAEARSGDKVRVRYRGMLPDGTEFDVSPPERPFEFKLGEGAVITGFEKAVLGMNVGETKTVTVPPEEGYGQRRDDLVGRIGRNHLPDDVTPVIGMMLEIRSPEGETLPVRIVAVEEDMVTLDANHEYAGETLTFEIELMEIVGED